MSAAYAYPQPFPGVPIKAPKHKPKDGEVVIRYDMVKGEGGCCNCSNMTHEGMVWLIVCAICFWPCAFIPCCKDSCHQDMQVPVYGHPPSGGASGAVYAPASQPHVAPPSQAMYAPPSGQSYPSQPATGYPVQPPPEGYPQAPPPPPPGGYYPPPPK